MGKLSPRIPRLNTINIMLLLMAEISNNHLGWCWNPINNGINYKLVSRISAINSRKHVRERGPHFLQVLELGAGRGLVGLSAWALGASMWVTDLAYTLEARVRGWNKVACGCGLAWGGWKNTSFHGSWRQQNQTCWCMNDIIILLKQRHGCEYSEVETGITGDSCVLFSCISWL